MSYHFTNNASSMLMMSIGTSDSLIMVHGAQAAYFPQPVAGKKSMITLEDRASGKLEICEMTARNGAAITVKRAQEGTAAQPFTVGGTIVSHRLTALALNEFLEDTADFGKRYLGSSSVPPTTDREGQDLQQGALYFDTTQQEMFVWTETGWQTLAGESESGRAASDYTWSAGAQTGNPGNHKLGLDNDDPTAAITIFINKLTNGNVDFTPMITKLRPDDIVFWQAATDPTRWLRYKVVSVPQPQDDGVWFQIEVEHIAGSGTEPNDNSNVTVEFQFVSSGGGGGGGSYPPGGDAGEVLTVAEDFSVVWAHPVDTTARTTASSAETLAKAAVPKAGGTMTGLLEINSSVAGQQLLKVTGGAVVEYQQVIHPTSAAITDYRAQGPSAPAGIRSLPQGTGWGTQFLTHSNGTASFDATARDQSFHHTLFAINLDTADFISQGVVQADLFMGNNTTWTGVGAGLRTLGAFHVFTFEWIPSTGLMNLNMDNGAVNRNLLFNNNARELAVINGDGPLNKSLSMLETGGAAWEVFLDKASDQRIKNNIRPTEVDALQVICSTPVMAFTVRDEDERIGFVAQQLQRTIPEMVHVVDQTTNPDKTVPRDLHVVVMQLGVPYLFKAVQQLAARVEALEAKLADLGGH